MAANPSGIVTRGFQPKASPSALITRGFQARSVTSVVVGTIEVLGFPYYVYGALTDSPDSPPNPPLVIGADHWMAGSYQKAAAWAAAGNADVRGSILVDATRVLDGFRWAGSKTSASQPLAWPRTGVTRLDGTAVDSTVYPLEIVYACYELAYLILTNPAIVSDRSTTRAGNVASVGAGSAKVSFFRPQAGAAVPPSVWAYISQFMAGRLNSSIGVGAATGTDGVSSFDDTGDFYLTGQP